MSSQPLFRCPVCNEDEALHFEGHCPERPNPCRHVLCNEEPAHFDAGRAYALVCQSCRAVVGMRVIWAERPPWAGDTQYSVTVGPILPKTA